MSHSRLKELESTVACQNTELEYLYGDRARIDSLLTEQEAQLENAKTELLQVKEQKAMQQEDYLDTKREFLNAKVEIAQQQLLIESLQKQLAEKTAKATASQERIAALEDAFEKEQVKHDKELATAQEEVEVNKLALVHFKGILGEEKKKIQAQLAEQTDPVYERASQLESQVTALTQARDALQNEFNAFKLSIAEKVKVTLKEGDECRAQYETKLKALQKELEVERQKHVKRPRTAIKRTMVVPVPVPVQAPNNNASSVVSAAPAAVAVPVVTASVRAPLVVPAPVRIPLADPVAPVAPAITEPAAQDIPALQNIAPPAPAAPSPIEPKDKGEKRPASAEVTAQNMPLKKRFPTAAQLLTKYGMNATSSERMNPGFVISSYTKK